MAHPEVLAIRRHAPVVLMCVVLGAASAGAFALRAPHLYESHVVVFVAATRTPDSGSAYDRALFAQDRVRSYVPIVASPVVLNKVIRALTLTESAEELAGKLSVTAAPDTVLLTISVRESTAVLAQRVANETAHQFTSFITTLEGTSGGLPTVELNVTRPAQLEPSPVSPSLVLDVWIGAFFGGAVGLSVAALRRRWAAEGVGDSEELAVDVPPSLLGRRRAVDT